MKEIAITLMVSEKDFDKVVKNTIRKYKALGLGFSIGNASFIETAKSLKNNEDNIIELSKREPEMIDKEDIIEVLIMEKSLENLEKGNLGNDDIMTGIEKLLGIEEDE